MKELSNEDKAKRYDEAYKVAKNIHIFSSDLAEIKRMEEIFPELKEESEGERIRKRICKLLWDNAPYEEAQEYITWLEKQGQKEYALKSFKDEDVRKFMQCIEKQAKAYEFNLPNRGYDVYAFAKDLLVWLEEQGEQKPVIEMKTPEESLGIDSETYNKIVDECIYGVQKLANKIEPKDYSSIDPHFFKTTDKIEPKFKVGDNIEPIDSCLGSPRTIYKICDGFYETNQGTLDFEFENNWRLIEQKPAWSEEDEELLNDIIVDIEVLKEQDKTREGKAAYRREIGWLKSLKDRVQPKQEWSEEDDEHLERILKELGNQRQRSINSPYLDKIESDYNWLKSIKERVGCEVNCTTTWKPSDEQMDELRKYSDNVVLRNLYYNLKKLKE